jgi:methylmalonyl-CoA mutase cobalamin-binding domain/chain
MSDHIASLTRAVADLEFDDVPDLLKEALAAGEDASALLQALSAGMVVVGERFESGEYFLADLVLAGELMKEGLQVLEPRLADFEKAGRGTVVLCTVRGDVHDIGKNLVSIMLASAGFEVIDLGVDVSAERVVEAVRKNGARAVGLSVLLTTMVGSIGEVVDALEEAGLRQQVKIAIGGACTTAELARRYRVDAMGRDAVEAVRIFQGWMD